MIRVMVVIWGLVMYVPDGTPENPGPGLTALFVNGQHVAGHEHVAIAWQHLGVESNTPPNPLPLNSGFFDVKLTVPGTMTSPRFPDMVSIATLAEGDGSARIRSECMRGDASCSVGGHPLVSGRVRFEGAWESGSASRCKFFEWPIGFRDRAVWDFRLSANGDVHSHSPTKDGRLATALVLSAEVDSLEDMSLWIGGVERDDLLVLSSKRVCEQFVGMKTSSGEQCVFIELASRPATPPTLAPTECDLPNAPDRCRLDTHFGAFYELLTSTASAQTTGMRYLPFLRENIERCYSDDYTAGAEGGAGHDPVPRCPGTYAYAANE